MHPVTKQLLDEYHAMSMMREKIGVQNMTVDDGRIELYSGLIRQARELLSRLILSGNTLDLVAFLDELAIFLTVLGFKPDVLKHIQVAVRDCILEHDEPEDE